MRDHAFSPALEVGIRPFVSHPPCRPRPCHIQQIICRGFLVALLLTAGCASETLFKSNFDANAIGQPPHMRKLSARQISMALKEASWLWRHP